MEQNMIGTLIKAARQARKLTQKQVGDALGINDRHVQAWEAGRRSPGPKYLTSLAEVLGLQIIDLLPTRK